MLRRLACLSWTLSALAPFTLGQVSPADGSDLSGYPALAPFTLGQVSPSPVPVQCGHAANRPADVPKPKRVDLQKGDAGIATGRRSA